MDYQAERDRVLQILAELDNHLQVKRADLLGLSSKWSKNLMDDEPDFSSNPGDEEDLGSNFDENLGGTLDGDLILSEDNSDPSSDTAGSITGSIILKRKRKEVIPSFSRELNLRRRERKNYDVGSPLRKRRKPKSVSIVDYISLS